MLTISVERTRNEKLVLLFHSTDAKWQIDIFFPFNGFKLRVQLIWTNTNLMLKTNNKRRCPYFYHFFKVSLWIPAVLPRGLSRHSLSMMKKLSMNTLFPCRPCLHILNFLHIILKIVLTIEIGWYWRYPLRLLLVQTMQVNWMITIKVCIMDAIRCPV